MHQGHRRCTADIAGRGFDEGGEQIGHICVETGTEPLLHDGVEERHPFRITGCALCRIFTKDVECRLSDRAPDRCVQRCSLIDCQNELLVGRLGELVTLS